MQLTITNEAGDFRSVDLSPYLTVDGLKALVEDELGIQPNSQELVHNGRTLSDGSRALAAYGIVGESEMVLLRKKARPVPLNPPPVGQPAPSTAGESSDAALMNVETQRMILERIRQERIHENFAQAVEYHPEMFGSVHMLYVDVEVNGYPCKAFVDSGAQQTIMSPQLATKCGLSHLIDSRFSGIARGVGEARILGRINAAQMKIGSHFLMCSFSVVENKSHQSDVNLLFGLDMLRRHQIIIDLKGNCLRIGEAAVGFLAEHELPNEARWAEGEANTEDLGTTTPAPSSVTPEIAAPTSDDPGSLRNTGLVDGTKIDQLMAIVPGIPRQVVINTLQAAGGDVEVAAGLLLGNSQTL